MHPLVEELRRELCAGLAGLNAEETQWRTGDDPGRWSVQQIAEHLMLTYRLSSETFQTRIAKGVPTQARPSVGQRVGQWVLLDVGHFPKGRAAPAMVMPSADALPASGEVLVEDAGELLRRFDGLADEAEQRFGGQRAISHPVLGPLSVPQWRRFHLVHGKHHLKQIAAICSGHRR